MQDDIQRSKVEAHVLYAAGKQNGLAFQRLRYFSGIRQPSFGLSRSPCGQNAYFPVLYLVVKTRLRYDVNLPSSVSVYRFIFL